MLLYSCIQQNTLGRLIEKNTNLGDGQQYRRQYNSTFSTIFNGKSLNGQGGSCCGLFGDLGGLKIEKSVIFPYAFPRFQCPSNPKIFVGSTLHHLFEEKKDGELYVLNEVKKPSCHLYVVRKGLACRAGMNDHPTKITMPEA